MPISTIDTSSISGLGYGFKNRIINGGMVIDQRNNGASVSSAANGTYFLDRWRSSQNQNSKFSVQQNAGAVTPPSGFTNYLGVTSSSAYSALTGDYITIGQKVEGFNVADFGWGAAGAQAVTLSFWVRSSLTGTFGGAVANGGSTRSYPFTYTVSASNTWEQKTITIPGDTTGSWLTTNGVGLSLYFNLGTGSTFSGTAGAWAGADYVSATGATSVVGTSGATFYITGVQLEKGTVATSFDWRPYGTELQLCQRYFAPNFFGFGRFDNSTLAQIYGRFVVPMRATPTLGAASGSLDEAGIAARAITGTGASGVDAFGGRIGFTTSAGTTGAAAGSSVATVIPISAEL